MRPVLDGSSAFARGEVTCDGDEHFHHLSLIGDEAGDDLVRTANSGFQVDRGMFHLLLQLQQSGQVGLHEDKALQRFSQALAHDRTLVDRAVHGL